MENVKLEIRDAIAFITIDRPKVLNALNAQTVAEIGEAFEQVRNDNAVRAVILTGGGEKAFVAGADINELATMNPISGKRTARLHGDRAFPEAGHRRNQRLRTRRRLRARARVSHAHRVR